MMTERKNIQCDKCGKKFVAQRNLTAYTHKMHEIAQIKTSAHISSGPLPNLDDESLEKGGEGQGAEILYKVHK